jgi:RNA polymerase sigma-70 factor, ECF subfamily
MAATPDTGRINPSPSGDREAFEKLIFENQKMIHALCFRMTGSVADAEDLAQETFVSAYGAWSTFRAESKVSSWLYRIAVNQCLNWKTRKQRQARLLQDWADQSLSLGPAESNISRQIQDALVRLPAKQRAAIVLTTYDGLNHAQAAKVLGCSETTVSWRLFAARRKLKQLLKGLKN